MSNTTQAAYMPARRDWTMTADRDLTPQDFMDGPHPGPWLIPVKVGDIVHIADIDRQGPGTTDITAASIEPIPDLWNQLRVNISVTQLGLARITRVFTHHYLKLDQASRPSGGMFLLVHVEPIDNQEV